MIRILYINNINESFAYDFVVKFKDIIKVLHDVFDIIYRVVLYNIV